MLIPPDLRYAPTHEWVQLNPDGTATIGITDYAQSSLGDITFVQLPKLGSTVTAQQPFGVVESVKAASDLYAPLSGTVAAVNPLLEAKPEQVNRAPYQDAWFIKVHPILPVELRRLMSAQEYLHHVR